MAKQLSLTEFIQRFPNDDVCLEVVFRTRFGAMERCKKCGMTPPLYYRVSARRCYECGKCGYHLYPCSGTIMHGSTTPLTVWFQALYLFSISRNGVSTHELERALGVDYRTAWRIGHKIRGAMAKAVERQQFSGQVEVDETLLGGASRGGKRGWGAENKVCIVGIVQRGGGVKTTPVVARNREEIMRLIRQYVQKGSTVNTDEFRAYNTLPDEGYQHKSVKHCRYEWTRGTASTNSMESYWSNLKKFISGTHTRVTPTYLASYLAEFDFRHSHRNTGTNMFERMFEEIIQI